MPSSVPPPRSPSRAPVLPGVSLRFGDMLDGLFRVDSRIDAERSVLQLAGSAVADGTPVVIQILVASGPSADQARFRFVAGARKANALGGPYVARVLDLGITPDGHPYVVREAVTARSLAAHLAEGRAFSTEEAAFVALAVCDALAESHRHGLLHGDLGPRSVHVAEGDVKVVDLGIGAAMAEMGLAASTIEAPSLHLRAPELLVPGRAVDARADVWGVGALLYTMLAGAPPFPEETPSRVSVSVEHDEPASLAGVPDALADLVDACLAKEPAQRPASMGALAEALAAFAPDADEVLARIHANAPALPETTETPAVPTAPARRVPAEAAAESSPTIVARAGYESFAHRATARGADSSVEIAAVAAPPAPLPPLAPPPPSAPSTLGAASGKSVAPVVVRREMPTVIVPRPRGRGVLRVAGLGVVAASLAIGVVIGASSARLAEEVPAAAAAAAPPPPPALTPTNPAPKAIAPTPAPEQAQLAPPASEPELIAVPASALPASRPAPIAATPPAAPPKKAVDPLAPSASAPIQPAPKAKDDDLRKFLDDRR